VKTDKVVLHQIHCIYLCNKTIFKGIS